MSSAPPVASTFDFKATASNLSLIGQTWYAAIKSDGRTLWVDDDVKLNCDAVLQKVCGFRVYTVWQKNDPFVKPVGGRGKAYRTIIAAAAAQPDRGVKWASQFSLWMDGALDFHGLPDMLKDLAVITHVAEVGRGYGYDLRSLRAFLNAVQDGTKDWSGLSNAFVAALTYKEDGEWTED